MTTSIAEYDRDQLCSLPTLCGSAYVLNFAGMLVLSTSGATINSLSSLIPRHNQLKSHLPLILARFTAMTSLLDFFATPIVGRISDTVGRRPILIVSMFISSICRYFRGRSRSLASYFFFGATGMVAGSAFFTTMNASFADIYTTKKSLALANSTLGLFRGLSFVLSPVLLGKMVGRNVRLAFNVSAGLTLSTGFIMLFFFRETHTVLRRIALKAERKRKGITESPPLIKNPLAFMLLLTRSPRLFYLTLCNAFQEFCEPRTMGTVGQLLINQQYKLTPTQIGTSMFYSGITMMLGPYFARRYFIPNMSAFHFSSLASSCHSIALLFKSNGFPFYYYLGMLPGIIGSQRITFTNAELTTVAMEEGLGSGEVAGAKANLDSLLRVMAPILYGYMYSKDYRYPFWFGSIVTLLSQLLYRYSNNLE
jgi:MFS transporter, DHA1 family, multidrug resistance protein